VVTGCKGVTQQDPFSEDYFVLLNLYCIRGKGCRKRGLKTVSNIITDILNKEPEQPVGDIFINRFGEAKNNLEKKLIK
jgi:hypothetical protein